MAEHSTLTGSQLHEPKGAASASANKVYVADGAGSGTWDNLPAASVSVTDSGGFFSGSNVEDVLAELYSQDFVLNSILADVSTSSTILIPIPFDCTVTQINFILGTSISGANSSITVTRSDGAAMGTQTILFSGSAEGTTFEFTPSGNNTMTYSSHKYIKIVTDGGSTGTCPVYVSALIEKN